MASLLALCLLLTQAEQSQSSATSQDPFAVATTAEQVHDLAALAYRDDQCDGSVDEFERKACLKTLPQRRAEAKKQALANDFLVEEMQLTLSKFNFKTLSYSACLPDAKIGPFFTTQARVTTSYEMGAPIQRIEAPPRCFSIKYKSEAEARDSSLRGRETVPGKAVGRLKECRWLTYRFIPSEPRTTELTCLATLKHLRIEDPGSDAVLFER